jgi:predicted permease
MHSLRILVRRPLLSTVAIVSLALGIGANLAIFRFVDAVLLQSLPGIPEPDQLAILRGGRGFGYPWFQEISRRNDVFENVAARYTARVNLTAGGETDDAYVEIVSGTYFETLGVRPAAGRLLNAADDGAEGASAVCVVSYALWQQRFGGDPAAVGRTIRLNTRDFQIVGVTQPDFRGAEQHARYDVQVPMSMIEALGGDRRDSWGWTGIHVFARLKPGYSRAQAATRLDAIGHQIDRDHGVSLKAPYEYTLKDGRQGLGGVRLQLGDSVLIAALLSGMVLLLARLNLANLLLARTTERRHEMAVRRALGATRSRLMAQLLGESLAMSAAGGAAALGVAAVLDRLLAAMLFGPVSRTHIDAAPSFWVGVAAVGFPLLAAAPIGILPAVVATQASASGLKDTPRTGASGRWPSRVLVVTQVAICLVLVFGAALLARTLRHLRTEDLGIHPDHVVVLTMDTGRNGYSRPQRQAFFDEVLRRAALTPGVDSAALAGITAMSGGMFAGSIRVPGSTADTDRFNNNFNVVTPDYFRTVGLPIVAGRGFTANDDASARRVVAVNQRFVDYYWNGQPAVGRTMTVLGREVEVVGIIRTAKYMAVREKPEITIYIPLAQRAMSEMTLHARTASAPETALKTLASAIKAVDPAVSVYDAAALDDYVDARLANERVLDLLSALLAALAVVVSMAGLYGLVATNVTRRRREIGVRLALGAQRGDVIRLFASETAALVCVGAALGIPLALATAKQFGAMLYGIEPTDPGTLAAAVAGLALVAAIAMLIPSARAARVDPAVVLRVE